MAKISDELTNELNNLTKAELIKIIVRFAKKDLQMNEILQYELVKSESEADLYEELLETIDFEMTHINGRIIQKELAKAISFCISKINDYKKVTKSKYYEALALQKLLNIIFQKYSKDLGTCWTIFDSKVVSTAKRYFNLVLTLHEDYHIEFEENYQKLLDLVKIKCAYYDSIYDLSKTFEEMKSKKIKNIK